MTLRREQIHACIERESVYVRTCQGSGACTYCVRERKRESVYVFVCQGNAMCVTLMMQGASERFRALDASAAGS